MRITKKRKRKVLLWSTEIPKIREGRKLVGGIAVQMYHWAHIFKDKGWNVCTFKDRETTALSDRQYIRMREFPRLNLLVQPIFFCLILLRTSPDLIIMRGASRDLIFVSLISRLYRRKLVFMLASDSDVIRSKELINARHDRLLYRIGLKMTKYVVCQNQSQEENLQINFSKISTIIIPNIWPTNTTLQFEPREFIIWVGNFRTLKRPHWFIELARRHPDREFVMIGGAIDTKLYDQCASKAKFCKNLQFLGQLNFQMTSEYFKTSRILVCTSEIEGFPNTFLQAWSNAVPVISTVDPSNIIENFSIGKTATTLDELSECIKAFDNKEYYLNIQNNINRYFKNSHRDSLHFDRLINAIYPLKK